jgi:hypothetical protein
MEGIDLQSLLGRFRRYLRRPQIALVCLAGTAVILICYVILSGRIASYVDSLRFSKKHTFDLEVPHEYLTERIALEFARRTLEAEGYDTANWKPSPEGYRDVDRKSEQDWFLTRARDPRRGRIQFVRENETDDTTRFVEIEISGNRVITYVWRPR